jgi:hypothetical protein
MHSPRVLFLDEPTIGLDPQTRRSIWSYIRTLKESEEITIFMTTHYMDEAEWCDRIAIMDQGVIVALDSPEALKARSAPIGSGSRPRTTRRRSPRCVERFDDRGGHLRGRGDLPDPVGRGVRAAAVRRARSADPLGQRLAPDPRRRLHVPHRQLDPRRRGVRHIGPQQDHDAGDVGRRTPVSTTSRAPAPHLRRPRRRRPRSSGCSVPQRSFASELRAIKIVWKRELIRYRSDRIRIATTLVQPLLFLFVLGSGLQSLSARARTAST